MRAPLNPCVRIQNKKISQSLPQKFRNKADKKKLHSVKWKRTSKSIVFNRAFYTPPQ